MARDREAQPHKQGKKRPFQVGPKLAKGAYTGHAQRIKKTLIHKAKVKKEYAKALKEAGYSSDPRVNHHRRDDEEPVELDQGPVRDEAKEEEEKERLRRRLYGDDDASDENEQSESEDEFEQERKGALTTKTRRRNLRTSASPSPSISPSPSPEPEPQPPIRQQPRSREPLPSQSSAAKDGNKKRSRQPPPAQKQQQTKTTPSNSTQQKPKRPKLSEAEIEKIREKKRLEKRQAGRKTQKGQAKLGAKMEGLLGKIQRSLAN
ncbi:hypothetical protein JCM5350_001284 [Sporobolomyces pararoseus]